MLVEEILEHFEAVEMLLAVDWHCSHGTVRRRRLDTVDIRKMGSVGTDQCLDTSAD